MAGSEASTSGAISVASHDTALCIIPPRHLWTSVDRLRALYDKAYEKWPPHVNLVYPFVRVESLERSAELLQSAVRDWKEHSQDERLHIRLDSAGVFQHKHDNTIYIHDNDQGRDSSLHGLRKSVLQSLGQSNTGYQMHLTVGQSDDAEGDAHRFLLHKVDSLPDVEWETDELSILVRERMQIDGASKSQMKLWGTIRLSDGTFTREQRPVGFYELSNKAEESDEETAERDAQQTPPPYCYNDNTGLWEVYEQDEEPDISTIPEKFVVASYNVLAEFTWPVSRVRYPLLMKNILADNAAADAIVLQEVTDDFLSHLLDNEDVRDAYPFVSHGPPAQSDIQPLPSLLNIVVLSKWAFDWEWVSFKRKHKGSVVVRFKDIGIRDDMEFTPVILASVHLTCGLTDGSVSNKKIELQRILNYLKKTYPENPWILAGDFNLSTSSFTIDAALKKKAISPQTSSYLASFDDKFREFGFVDAWSTARLEHGDSSDTDEVFEGEQGATFDPTVNILATKIVGSGFDNRPQRYDRILVKGEDLLRISRFNKFGLLMESLPTDDEEDSELEESFASDHWGVRCALTIGNGPSHKMADEIDSLVVPVVPRSAPESLANPSQLDETLSQLDVFPSEEEVFQRKNVLVLLRSIIVENSTATASDNTVPNRLKQSLILVPCGSYGLGVWTSNSDIDCLCIGPYSSQTFFALAIQRLRKAADRGVKILRRVRANTGTMLELEVQGVKMDLQYCPATAIAETWPTVLKLPSSHPVFTLSTQTLSKLKAARDMDYIRRSVPDLAKFRTAHRFIKTWAKSRGIYSAKFGYLGGIQVSVLLARVFKMLARDSTGPVTVPDILSTFFHHYAGFDWRNKIAFDPLFHKQRLQYTRTSREPLAILGYFPPALNTSHTASIPSVHTIAEEFRRADRLLSKEGMTWSQFLCGGDTPSPPLLDTAGATHFTKAYKTYVKIDVQYWGISPSRGASFVGWLESRCVMVLVDLQRRLPDVHARVWPARFVSAEDTADSSTLSLTEEEGSRDYQGCYLIGLEPAAHVETTREDAKVAAGTLQTVLRRFEEQIRGDEKYFDAKCQWMSAEVVKRGDLGELRVDNRQWGEYTPGDEEEDDEEEDEDAGAEEEDDPYDAKAEDETRGAKKGKKGSNKKGTANVVVPRHEGAGKLRSALDVLSRLRWDPHLDSSDYIVGYEDRFTGAREKPLEQWKSEQTDEEFIPQHRVLYFKRRSDGVIVWERRTRKDELFGSGH